MRRPIEGSAVRGLRRRLRRRAAEAGRRMPGSSAVRRLRPPAVAGPPSAQWVLRRPAGAGRPSGHWRWWVVRAAVLPDQASAACPVRQQARRQEGPRRRRKPGPGHSGVFDRLVYRRGDLLAGCVRHKLHRVSIHARIGFAGERPLACPRIAHLHETIRSLLELICSERNPDIGSRIRGGRATVLVQHYLLVTRRRMHLVDHARGVTRIRIGHIHIVLAVRRDIRREARRAARNEALVHRSGPLEARRLALGGAFQPRPVNLLITGEVLAVRGRLDNDLARLGERGEAHAARKAAKRSEVAFNAVAFAGGFQTGGIVKSPPPQAVNGWIQPLGRLRISRKGCVLFNRGGHRQRKAGAARGVRAAVRSPRARRRHAAGGAALPKATSAIHTRF